MKEKKSKKLVKNSFPYAPFNYLMEVTGYGVNLKKTTPMARAKEIQTLCIWEGKKAPKFFKLEDIEGVIENNKPVYLVDMSYYKNDMYIENYMWFEDVKKSKLSDDKIKLTREEQKKLKDFLFLKLSELSEYHLDLEPKKNWSLKKLLQGYFYWGEEYNDKYIPELDYDKEDKIAMYTAENFKEFLAMPVSVRY